MILAIDGGKPVRSTFLPYGKQSIDENDIKSVVDVLRGDYITTGPYINKFENKVANYVDAKYAVAVSNGTAALHLACLAAGIKEGDEVIVSSITFAASSNAVLYCGGKPIFADINPNTYNIDLEDIKRKITCRTKAIIAVDFTGNPIDIDDIKQICEENNLIFIEDGAHSLGSEYKNRKVGSLADMTTFSFHPVKPITTGEGGIITTNNKDFYDRLCLLRSHGITRNSDLIDNSVGPWHYEQLCLGFNYRMTDIQAALGISQIDKIDRFIDRRREIVSIYNKEFEDIKEIDIPNVQQDRKSGWHLYIIALNLNMIKVSRKEIFEALRAENIGVNVHYAPVYNHPYYKNMGYKNGICIESENLYERIITLPLYPSMDNKDIEDVVTAVKKVISAYKKES